MMSRSIDTILAGAHAANGSVDGTNWEKVK